MLTYSGINIEPKGDTAPAPEDLAVHMGRICQFGGAVWFNLLSHSIIVGELAYKDGCLADVSPCENHLTHWAWAMLHDAHEVVTQDIPRGWKTADMKIHQGLLDIRIARRYGINLSRINSQLIKRCDRRAVEIQAYVLGLKNYDLLQKKKATKDRVPEPNEDERELVRKLRWSRFNDAAESTLSSSKIIALAAEVFWRIEKQDLLCARQMIEDELASVTVPT